jgi:predicted nucleic acid-binding protein
LFEVAKHLPQLARRLEMPEMELFRAFQILPIISCQPDLYDAHLAEAGHWIGNRDPKDVPILALALFLHCPLWTEDRDFDGIPTISIRRTAELVAIL